MLFSLVVPCYNESKNLENLLKKCALCFEAGKTEVVLVDNGSTDDTAHVLKKLLPQYPFARSVTVKINQGYGFGILSGLRASKGKFLGWTHADLQTDPADAIEGLKYFIESGEDETLFVKGHRKNRSIYDLIFTVGMSFLDSLILGVGLWDINAQPNLFSRQFFKSWQNPPHDFTLDLYVYALVKFQKHKVIRFPVDFGKRLEGEAHIRGLKSRLKYTFRVLIYSFKVRKKLKK